MNEYVLQTENLSKRFGKQWGVDRLNLHLEAGRIYGLLGRNGAGKSTTMRMLLGLARPTSGRILLFGADCRNNPKLIYKHIGSLIESPGFYSNLSASENLGLLASLRGVHDADCVGRALRIMRLDQVGSKPFSKFSMGMKQRLGIAAAIMHQPRLLILDEPMNGLDPTGIHEIRNYLREISRKERVSILISSHVLSEIELLADEIGVMHKGRLLEELSLEEIRLRTRQYVEFQVSDENRTALYFERELGSKDYSAHGGGVIRLYSHLDKRAEINAGLLGAGVQVSGLHLSRGSLEDYFNQLIGDVGGNGDDPTDL